MSHIYFVYRTHYEGPLSKRVVRLPGRSLLEWFQGVWDEVKQAEEPWDWISDLCGGYVWSFSSFFDNIKKYDLPMPQTWQELDAILEQYLTAEREIRRDKHALRVRTDDDELTLAFFLFDQEIADAHPGRVAYLLQEEWKLPSDYNVGNYEPPIEIEPLRPSPRAQAEGKTYVCLLTFDDGDSIASTTAQVIDGIRLPDLCEYLRETIPYAEEKITSYDYVWTDTWPLELRLLRAMVDIEDKSIEPALQRCNQYPIHSLKWLSHTHLGIGEYEVARNEFETAGKSLKRDGDRQKSLIACSPHLAQLCIHLIDWAGYQQWFIFDDQWAAANSALADSLLRYASHWDPFRNE